MRQSRSDSKQLEPRLSFSVLAFVVLAAVVCPTLAMAQGSAPSSTTTGPAASSSSGTTTSGGGSQGQSKVENVLKGFGFGAGLTLTQDFGDHDRVEEVAVIDGIVRITKDQNVVPRFMLESHYFFTSDRKFLGYFAEGRWGWGPFVAVQSGDSDVIGAVGMGLMLGFRKGDANSSFNLGLGAVVDTNVKVLGDGIEANKPLPGGETEARTKETDQWGYLVAFSFSFD